MRNFKVVFTLLLLLFTIVSAVTPTQSAKAQYHVPPAALVTVVIDSVSTTMGDGCGAPDLYARIYIDGNGKTTRTITSRNFYPSDWSHRRSIQQRKSAPITIQMWESDDFFCGGGDDHVDISPNGAADITLWVYRSGSRCEVYNTGVMFPKWEPCGQTMNTFGNTHGGNNARITYRVLAR